MSARYQTPASVSRTICSIIASGRPRHQRSPRRGWLGAVCRARLWAAGSTTVRLQVEERIDQAGRRTSLIFPESAPDAVAELVEVDLGVEAAALLHVDTKRADLGVDSAPGRDDGLALDPLLDELERSSRR
jgi:hypothetical protein